MAAGTYTGSATGTKDLLNQLASILVNDHGFSTVSAAAEYTVSSVARRGLSLSKNGCNWHLLATEGQNKPLPDTNMVGTTTWGTPGDVSDSYRRPYDTICICGSVGSANASTAPYSQPNLPYYYNMSGTLSDFKAFTGAGAHGSIQSYRIFVQSDTYSGAGKPLFVWVVVEYKTKRYSHFGFGQLEKFAPFTGGFWFHGSHNIWETSGNYISSLMGTGARDVNGWTDNSQTWVYVAQDMGAYGNYANCPRMGWKCWGIQESGSGVQGHYGIIGAWDADMVWSDTQSIHSRNICMPKAYQYIGPPGISSHFANYDTDVGRFKAVPFIAGVGSLIPGRQDYVHPLGVIPHIFPIRLNHYLGGEYFDRGGDRYYVFPMNYRVDPLNSDGASQIDVVNLPGEIFVNGMWGHGYAIRVPQAA